MAMRATDFADARRRMVQTQLMRRGIEDKAVLHAMGKLRRECFVPKSQMSRAYEDGPLPICGLQTISQPYVAALMLEAAAIEPSDKCLEVGVGSGYAAAVMRSVSNRVFAIDRKPELVELARANLRAAGHDDILLRLADGTRGWPDAAPFDVIVVSAGAPSIPNALVDQLQIGGRLVMPIGEKSLQRLLRVVRNSNGRCEEEDLGSVMFVPLVGENSWADDEYDVRAPSTSEGSGRPH